MLEQGQAGHWDPCLCLEGAPALQPWQVDVFSLVSEEFFFFFKPFCHINGSILIFSVAGIVHNHAKRGSAYTIHCQYLYVQYLLLNYILGVPSLG